MSTAPLLTDEEAKIIELWAALHRHQLRAVLLYGSRYSGIRREKENPSPVPDVDLAVSIKGADQDTRQTLLAIKRKGWSDFLSSQLGGLPVEIMSADPDLGPWVVGILKDHGYRVLWSDPKEWSPLCLEG